VGVSAAKHSQPPSTFEDMADVEDLVAVWKRLAVGYLGERR
jgi:hypothetical protein